MDNKINSCITNGRDHLTLEDIIITKNQDHGFVAKKIYFKQKY